MGANVSAWQEANIDSSMALKKSPVVAFHSSAKWKIHFEASKETNKLVSIENLFHLFPFCLGSTYSWLLILLFLFPNPKLKIVIDFTASWCGPCQYIEPSINELAAKYTDVEFVKIDVDELDVCSHFS